MIMKWSSDVNKLIIYGVLFLFEILPVAREYNV